MNKTVWYIQPKSGITTEALGREVGEEDTCYKVVCSDGRPRKMYRVPWSLIQEALDRGEPLRFKVWRQRGAAPAKPFDLTFFTDRVRRSPKFRDAAEALEKQLKRTGHAHRT